MCGIAGIVNLGSDAPPIDATELRRIRDSMSARGPDDSGEWTSEDSRVGLAHRRLAIIDLSRAGAQPMHDPATDCRITFNGEIYNYRELRSRLEEGGHRFRTNTDTEVLLHAYAAHGEEMLPMLRGMFAFCIWDPRRRMALLARDPLGIKPLYVASARGTVRFASQVKALLGGGAGAIDTSPDPAARVGFFVWGNVPEPRTMYRGIRMLPAGSFAWIDGSGLNAHRTYYELSREIAAGEAMSDEPAPETSLREELRAGLARSINAHLVADVPVGVFLSAGIDSSSIASLAGSSGSQRKVRTLTVTCPEFGGTNLDESPIAERIAAMLGTDHRTVLISKGDFEQDCDRLFRAMDQPTIDGVNTYFVSKAAAAAGLKVVLSGVGGDELFAGYGYYRKIPRQLAGTRPASSVPGLGTAVRMASGRMARIFGKAKAASLFEYGRDVPSAYLLHRALYMPWELASVLDPGTIREGLEELAILDGMRRMVAGIRSPALQICALDMAYYMRNQLLRDSDWASMAHSIELRTPLVDAWLVRDVMRLRSMGLRVLKSEFMRAVDPAILRVLESRPKTGFYVPVDRWMRRTHKGHQGRGNEFKRWATVVLDRLADA